MAKADEVKNQKELNQERSKFNNLNAETNKYSEKYAQQSSTNLDLSRQLNAELRDQLGINQRISDQAKDLRNLGNEVSYFAKQNVIELGNANKLEREIFKAQQTKLGLIREIDDISKELTRSDLEGAQNVSDSLADREEAAAQLKEAQRLLISMYKGTTAASEAEIAAQQKLKEELNATYQLKDSQFQVILKETDALKSINKEEIHRVATLSSLLGLQDENITKLQDEETLQGKINDRIGVTGAIIEGVGGIMQRLGMRSGIFDDAMKGARATMDDMAEKSVRVLGYELNEAGETVPVFEENFNKTQIAIAGAIELSRGFRQALFDPLTLSLAILDAFLSVDKAASDLQQKIGVNTSEFVAQNDALATSVQQMELMSDLADKTGRNVAAIFTSQQIGEAAELQNLLGLSADQAGELAIIAQEAGRSVGDTADNVFEQVDAFNKVNKTAISGNAVLKDIGDASFDIKASFLAFPDGIAKAATAAKRLGMNLDDVNNIADSLMDFESSIEAELEAQLLTGKQINMAKARELALSNDLAGLSNELFKNSVEVAEYGKMNRIQQQALAKSMGISTEQLAKMAYNRGLDAKMTDKQLKAATGLERSDYERMAAQETMQVALGKLAQAFAPILDVVGNVASALAAIITPAAKLVGLITSTTIGKIGIVALAGARAAGLLQISLGGVKKALTQNIVAQKLYNVATGISNTLKGAYISLTTSETAVNMRAAIAKRAKNAADIISNNVNKIGLALQNTRIGKYIIEKAALVASTVAKYANIGATFGQAGANTTLATSQKAVATTASTAGAGLGAFGAAAAPAIPIILAIGAGLLLASPAIYAFGLAIKAAFNGIANIVTAVGGAISMMLDKITLEKAAAMGVMGLSFISLAGGLTVLSASIFTALPAIGILGSIALMGPGLLNAGNGMEKMAAGVAKLSEALKTLEVDKLDNLQDFTVKAAVAGVAASGVGAIGEMITSLAGGSGEGENQELLARVDRLISAVEQDRVTKVYMNGNQMSMQMTQENPRQG